MHSTPLPSQGSRTQLEQFYVISSLLLIDQIAKLGSRLQIPHQISRASLEILGRLNKVVGTL
jgi:hypothetical protein